LLVTQPPIAGPEMANAAVAALTWLRVISPEMSE
jgi:hypothetical protein